MFQRHLSDESLHGNLAMSKIYQLVTFSYII
jgi:hypothetical protein